MLLLEERRMTRDALRYGFAVGKVRVLETRMLDRAAFERLLDAPTLAEQRRVLSETVYGRYIEHAQTAEDLERGLDEALDGFYGYLDEAALPHEVVSFFRVRYDFANLKATIKARLFDAPLEDMIVVHGTLPAESFAGALDELPEPYGALASDLADVDEPEEIDVRVDAAMYQELPPRRFGRCLLRAAASRLTSTPMRSRRHSPSLRRYSDGSRRSCTCRALSSRRLPNSISRPMR